VITSSYKLSFTVGGLLYRESLVVVDEYSKGLNWEQTVEKVNSQNLLQARTQSAGKRVLREIIVRLKLLNEEQLELIRHGSHHDQLHLLWLAACKRYELLRDFGSEVIRDKFLQLDIVVRPDDFDKFLESKAVWHQEIEKLTDSTRTKLRQVTFLMLREADIISADNVIQPVVLSAEIAKAIQSDSTSLFSVFPVSESDVRRTLS